MPNLDELFSAAVEARDRAYARYSHFTVGAALETTDGRIFTGANIENASYGLTVCAERVAIFTAVHAGATGIAAMAVTGPDGITTPPCGACRQVIAEFADPGVEVRYALAYGILDTTVAALLPGAFTPEALDAGRGVG
jgi:homotetrameric cytidine deaminase